MKVLFSGAMLLALLLCPQANAQGAQSGALPTEGYAKLLKSSAAQLYSVWYRSSSRQRWRCWGYGLTLYDASNAVKDLRRQGYSAYYERD